MILRAIVLMAAGGSAALPDSDKTAAAQLHRALQLAARSDGLLGVAPRSVAVSGMWSCDDGQRLAGNAAYALQPELMNGKPHWTTAEDWHIYWTPNLQGSRYPAWLIGRTTLLEGLTAYFVSGADLPPSGTETWEEARCGSGEEQTNDVTLTAPLSPTNCAALAEYTKAKATCVGVTERVAAYTGAASEDLPCSDACAELWLDASSHCDGKGAVAFEAAAPVGMTTACGVTAAALLATAPRTVTISGLACHGTRNGEYELQPAPLNRRPHYATRNQGSHLHWMPDGGGGLTNWVIGTSAHNSGTVGNTMAYLISSAEATPIGSALWTEVGCGRGGKNANVRLDIVPSRRDAAQCATSLSALAPLLTVICCGPEDGLECGQNGVVPTACSVDCANLWLPYAQQCPSATDLGDPNLTSFFASECGVENAALVILDETATLEVCTYCNYQGDGECDEPEYCDVGTDNADCRGGIDKQKPCCSFTHDGECDEPGDCPVNTDNADCRGGIDPPGDTHVRILTNCSTREDSLASLHLVATRGLRLNYPPPCNRI